ncbi:MAG: S16 family serine protease [Verrucomicrobiia bacterium]
MNRVSLSAFAAALLMTHPEVMTAQQPDRNVAREMIAEGEIVPITAKREEGYVIGRLPARSVIHLQYVEGKWKAWGNYATACPDDPNVERGERNRLVIAEVSRSGTQHVLAVVPPETSLQPFSYPLSQDADKVVLRINDNDNDFASNPDAGVQYCVYVKTPTGRFVLPPPSVGAKRQPGKPTTDNRASNEGKQQPARVAGVADSELQRGSKSLARNQTSIKGLFVVRTSAGLRVGGAQDIIATAERTSSNRETICDFVTDVAKDTQISMEEAERLLKVRYPVWQAGYKIRFSYSNKYTKQAGGSAGGAFSVLLLSLLDGMQIDPGFGMTGDVTVDGKIREVGAVAEKLRGALLDKCRIIAIPEANKENLSDLAVLYSPAMLWSMQILSIATLDDAAAVARVDRAPNLAKAMELFGQVQRSLSTSATAYALRNAGILQTLQQVLQLAPNHSSAEFMIRAANNQLPATLSLGGSLDEIWAAAGPLLGFLFTDYKEPQKSKRYYFEKVPSGAFKAAMERLNWLQMRLHPKTRDLKTAMTDYMASLDQLHRQSAFSAGTLRLHIAKRDKVLSEAHLLGTDRKALEEMMH